MKKEVSKKVEAPKVTLPQVMEKYGGMFSIELKNGFAHLKFVDGEMVVTWLNDEGYEQEDGQEIPYADIEVVANFMREMKELKLPEYVSSPPSHLLVKNKIMKYKIKSGKLKGEIIELEEVKENPKTLFEGKTLEWGESSNERMTWKEAQEWCKEKGDGWRLPTIQELLSVYDYDKGEPKIPSFVASYYWSSTTVPSASANAYFVHFNYGYMFFNAITVGYYVHCVR